MITHDEARELVDKIYVHTDWETKDKLTEYIAQQEQFAKDVARYLWLLTYEYGEDYQVGKISLVEYRCLELEEEELKQKLTKGVAK